MPGSMRDINLPEDESQEFIADQGTSTLSAVGTVPISVETYGSDEWAGGRRQ
jgi:hypothetical protein